jgi:exodeoxyribonuclease-3
MRVATWNVNSIRQRLGHLARWAEASRPDVVCLQETKVADDAFPEADVRALGFHVARLGQPSYNGVAILSRDPIEVTKRGLPGAPDDLQARFLEARVATRDGALRLASVYAPNGNPAGSEKYAYKLAWMERLAAHVRALVAAGERVVLAGDFNVIPAPEDVHDPEAWAGDALFLPETRARFGEILALGLVDALRAVDPRPGLYTFFDYQAGAWRRRRGLRIDHFLVSREVAGAVRSVAIDIEVRGWERPSDHAPVRMDLAV